ncbi:MAG: sensor N-terminal transmembrane domain-containing protein [Commensalibacter sp.]|nr:sensor N-terminal transmembrane domain-containing protein [Commensalibacter sp.]
MVNTLPLVVLVVTLLYLNQFQNSLLETEINVLREQAKIYAGALSQSAIKKIKDDVFFRSLDFYALVPEQRNNQSLSVELARPLLLSLTNPSPRVRARFYAVNGKLVIHRQN